MPTRTFTFSSLNRAPIELLRVKAWARVGINKAIKSFILFSHVVVVSQGQAIANLAPLGL